MASETIVAVFSSLSEAEAAIGDLVSAGVPSTSIKHYARDDTENTMMTSESGRETQQRHGFWAWLTGQDNSTDQHDVYDRSIRSGRTVVTVVSDTSSSDRVHDMLERHNPLDLDDHEGAEGAGTGRAHVTDLPATATSTSTLATGTTGATYGTATDTVSSSDRRVPPGLAADNVRAGEGEQVIPLSEESLEIGKRRVDRGSTRIRRYTVERPVEEQIRLRDETVSVSRRPVTGRTDVGADAFTDREIVVNESEEQAVVGKTSHVVEEVVVQKGMTERTETVRDTVRREEVEINGPEGRAVQTGGTSSKI